MLRDNPNLENEIWKDIDNEHKISEYQEKLKSETTIGISFNRNYSLRTCILLAVLKKYFTVYHNDRRSLYIGEKTKECTGTEEFPVNLFFSCIDEPSNFVCIHNSLYSFNYYNKSHPFSQWLIAHQKELMEKVQGVYNDMIKTMVEGQDATDIMNFLNKSLKFLQKYQNNHFKIDDTIFLKPEHFA